MKTFFKTLFYLFLGGFIFLCLVFNVSAQNVEVIEPDQTLPVDEPDQTLPVDEQLGMQTMLTNPITVVPFYCVGSVVSWIVPFGVSDITISANGAGGYHGSNSAVGGAGGNSIGELTVIAGQTYYISVGCTGSGKTGGFGGGGNGYTANYGGAGGKTWFGTGSTFSSTTVLILAGGGGGGGNGAGGAGYGKGGAGGGKIGEDGSNGGFGNGTGGTQTNGGTTGGLTGQGGNGTAAYGGGGGGGYFGGGGSTTWGGGGGGSGFISSIAFATSTTQNGGSLAEVNGILTIAFITPATSTPATSTPLACSWPANSDISVITACKIITSTTTTGTSTSLEYDFYYSPAILYFYIFSLMSACFTVYFIFKK